MQCKEGNLKEKHSQIYGCTKHHDLFSKELIILPICKNVHWYVAVLIKAGNFEDKKLSVLNDDDDKQDIIDTICRVKTKLAVSKSIATFSKQNCDKKLSVSNDDDKQDIIDTI